MHCSALHCISLSLLCSALIYTSQQWVSPHCHPYIACNKCVLTQHSVTGLLPADPLSGSPSAAYSAVYRVYSLTPIRRTQQCTECTQQCTECTQQCTECTHSHAVQTALWPLSTRLRQKCPWYHSQIGTAWIISLCPYQKPNTSSLTKNWVLFSNFKVNKLHPLGFGLVITLRVSAYVLGDFSVCWKH